MGPGQQKRDLLNQRMEDLGIRKSDLQERFIKSSGRGGQKVNKSSSAVFIRHVPTGISVKCGRERSQDLNRFLALRRLVERLEVAYGRIPDKRNDRFEKIRRQKKKRQRRAAYKYGSLPLSQDSSFTQ